MKELTDILGGALKQFGELRGDLNKHIGKLPEKQREQFIGILSEIDKGVKEKDVNLLNKQMEILQNIQKNG